MENINKQIIHSKEEFKKFLDEGQRIEGNIFIFYKFENIYYYNCGNDTCFGGEKDFKDYWDVIRNWERFKDLRIIP